MTTNPKYVNIMKSIKHLIQDSCEPFPLQNGIIFNIIHVVKCVSKFDIIRLHMLQKKVIIGNAPKS